MQFRRSEYHPRCFGLLLAVCVLALSINVIAAGKGKKGKPEAPAKQTVARKDSRTEKAAAKKDTTKSAKQPDRNARTREKARDTQLAKNVRKEDESRKGKKGSADKKEKSGKDKLAANTKSKVREAEVKSKSRTTEKSVAARNEIAKVPKNEKQKQTAVKETARIEKVERKPEREEKIVQSKLTPARDKEPQVAETQPERKGKFGKAAERETASIEIVQNKPVFDNKPENKSAKPVETIRVVREIEPPPVIVPDRVEVIEYDPRNAGADVTASSTRPLRAYNAQSFNVSNRRIEVKIDAERVTQIQEALQAKGFYSGELTGVWDDLTYDAMKRFQVSQKVDATGYPTAHSLKRLGLTNW